ncbi:MAG: polysaccharide biosynthesis C-terminal domain-containing protein, partial [Caulobacteraceae bacterium]|nr:polysaccharide biosynthesis C-terminal domain-containing protein [Caulobacteraceae bacterium]
PAVARAAARGDMAAFGATARDSLRLTAFLTLPAAAGLAALAHPIIALIYQHGRFDAHDTDQTALALQAYAVGLAGYAFIRVLVPCFYALGLPRTPLRVSLIGIAFNLALNLLNARVLGLGHAGLALTTSAVATLNATQLSVALARRADLGSGMVWTGYLLRCAAAASVCGAAAFGFNAAVEHETASRLLRAIGLAVVIPASVLVYFGAAHLFRLTESQETWRMIRRRLPGRRGA